MTNSIFKNSMSLWARYDDYQWRKTDSGELFLLPSDDAEFVLYDPLDDVDTFVLDTTSAAVKCFRLRNNRNAVMQTITEYVGKYGLLGIINALPSTADYMKYDKVFLPKNLIFRDEVIPTSEYIDKFYPFEKPVFKVENNRPSCPPGMAMPTLKQYGEQFEWLMKVFKDWGLVIICTSTYAQDMWEIDKEELEFLRAGLAAFDGNAPSYHIYLEEGPKLCWDFHSLLQAAQMMFSMMLTDPHRPLRICHRCYKPFIAKGMNAKYCSKECRAKK